MRKPICLNPEEIFHVHTWRCGHAGEEKEEAYIKEAIRLGAKQITFTDHAPFPGDFFRGRMRMDQLKEYKETLWELREKYKEVIRIRIGLEAEYLPEFTDYYKALKEDEQIEFLMLGQHFYEVEPGVYSFSGQRKEGENRANGIMQAQLAGIESGFFSCIAHPDRGYRYLKKSEDADMGLAKEVIAAAETYQISFEKNLSSMERSWFYEELFWNFCNQDYIVGLDAHSVTEMINRYRYTTFFDR